MRINVCCGCLSGFVHGIVDAVHLRLSFLLFSFGRLDFAASTLSFLSRDHIQPVRCAVGWSSSFQGIWVHSNFSASFSVECVLDP